MWFNGADLRLHARLPARGEADPLHQDPPHDLGQPARALEGHRVRRQPPGARALRDRHRARTGHALGGCCSSRSRSCCRPCSPSASASSSRRSSCSSATSSAPSSSSCASCSTRRRSSTALGDLPDGAAFVGGVQPARPASSPCTAPPSSPSSSTGSPSASAAVISLAFLGVGILVFRRTERAVLKEI